MSELQRRDEPDRRRVARGGRRPYDQAGRYPSVIVADSFDGARRPCVSYLHRLNFDVIEVSTREEMAARLQRSMPRLVLAERALPGGQGTRHWLDVLQWCEIPVIVIANTEESNTPLPAGAGLLRKPFTLAQMIAEVRRVLRETDRFSTMQVPRDADQQKTPDTIG